MFKKSKFETMLNDFFGRKEDLRDELKDHVTHDPIPMLRHPLVYCIMYSKEMNAMLNKQFEFKSEKLKAFEDAKDWMRYISMYEPPYRFSAFQTVHDRIESDKDYWEILRYIWIDSENIWEEKDTWRVFLNSSRPNSENFMTKEERRLLSEMPNALTMYRGCKKGKNEDGFSYTLSKEKADWFSKRFLRKEDQAIIIKKIVPRADVFAYIKSRGEEEIILF